MCHYHLPLPVISATLSQFHSERSVVYHVDGQQGAKSHTVSTSSQQLSLFSSQQTITDDRRGVCVSPSQTAPHCAVSTAGGYRSRYLPADAGAKDVCRGQKQQRVDCKVADSGTVGGAGIWDILPGNRSATRGTSSNMKIILVWACVHKQQLKAGRSIESDVICFLNKALPSVVVTSGVRGLFLPVSRCDETMTPE